MGSLVGQGVVRGKGEPSDCDTCSESVKGPDELDLLVKFKEMLESKELKLRDATKTKKTIDAISNEEIK